MKEVIYDWLSLNEWLFKALYTLNFPYLNEAWRVLSYGYSLWVGAFIVLAISIRYLKVRRSAPEQQFEIMSELMVVLFIGLGVVWCCVYTFQNITLYPRPWTMLPDLVPAQVPLLWHEGLPASAPAISMLVACMFWPLANSLQHKALAAYVILGCLLSVMSGVNWPVEVVCGAALGFAGTRFAQWYYRFGKNLVVGAGDRK